MNHKPKYETKNDENCIRKCQKSKWPWVKQAVLAVTPKAHAIIKLKNWTLSKLKTSAL